uniref:Uncharacterized protein n=1 Tax=Mustela putorius furo TaxID=9669 RepID=M3XRE6_MUSPF
GWLQTCLSPRSRPRPSHSSPPSPRGTAARGDFASRTCLLGLQSPHRGAFGPLAAVSLQGEDSEPSGDVSAGRSSEPREPRVGASEVLGSALGELSPPAPSAAPPKGRVHYRCPISVSIFSPAQEENLRTGINKGRGKERWKDEAEKIWAEILIAQELLIT